jgi:hypothetical protein
MDSLSDRSFQNLTPTVWLDAAPAPMASTHSSTSESSAAPERFRNVVILQIAFLSPQRRPMDRHETFFHRFVTAKIS